LAIIISIVETFKSCGEAMEGGNTLCGGQLGQFHDMCMLLNITWKINKFKRLNSRNNGYIYGICNII
jgi:hypothetical protein